MSHHHPRAVLRAISAVLPETVIEQQRVRDIFARQEGLSRLGQRLVATAFDSSGIDTRHTVITDFADDSATGRDGAPTYIDDATGALQAPGTKARNDHYIAAAGPIFVEAARRAIHAADGIDTADVTHVITVSCTGFFAPGPEYLIARDLGLDPAVQRYHLGFMGCYAALPALRMAAQFCDSDPNAVVLVVSVELCTLHLHASDDPDVIVANSLFGDAGVAGIVTRRPLGAGERGLQLDRSETAVTPVGEADMAWTIGDEGFDMVLSTAVPQIIGEHISAALGPLVAGDERLSRALDGDALGGSVARWAVHPGGRSIVDKVEEALRLEPHQVAPSRDVLRTIGNVSSATVLVVMQRNLEAYAEPGDRLIALAFGPGLTVESTLMTVVSG
ncbi:type III polyketide synthase [Microcella sp.]|uniref:type III polyketide synthase n=1 Tax=Microcella sp. TaxID=1913979 RepID=UPI0039193789